MVNVLERKPPKADFREAYGPGPLQFGDLWMPAGAAPAGGWPVLIFIHGGWWKAAYDLAYAGFLCQAMKAQGVAVWSIEYRRVGDAGGGWPGTLQDVAAGTDFVATLAQRLPLNTGRVVAAGHSAGGHLAFWLAGRHHIPVESVLHQPQPKVALHGVVGLAGAVDLRLVLELGGPSVFTSGPPAVEHLMGGLPEQVPERYEAANPGDLLPLGVAQTLMQGTADDQIPPTLPQRWAEKAERQGDHVELKIVPGADHMELVDPQSPAWPVCRDAMLHRLRG